MRRSMVVFIVVSVIAALYVGLIGCEGPQGPVGPSGDSLPVYLWGAVGAPELEELPAYVLISNVHEIPSVEINGIRIPFTSPLTGGGCAGYFLQGIVFSLDDFSIPAGDSASLVVTYTKVNGNPGTARANIVLPDQFEITSHDTSSVVDIPVGTGLTVSWTSSKEADAYHVYLDLDYDYTDTSGAHQSFYFSADTLITDAFITFLPSQLFPDAGKIKAVESSRGEFDISAIAGPLWEGAEGNVTGDGIGFFYGLTFGGHLDLEVSGSEYMAGKRAKPEVRFQKTFMDLYSRRVTLTP